MKDEKLDFGDEIRFKQNILNYISNYVLKLKMDEGVFDIYLTVYMDFGYTYRMYKLYYPGSCLDNTSGEDFNKVKFRTALKKALFYTRDYVLNRRHPLVSINGFVELSLTSGNIRCEAFTLDITEEHRKLNRPIFSPNLITIEPINDGNSSQETQSRGPVNNGKKVIRPNSSGVLLETFEGTSSSPETVNGTEEATVPKETVATVAAKQRPLNPPIATANRKGATIVIALPTDYNNFDNAKQNRITNVPHVRTTKKSNDKNILPIQKKKSDTSSKSSSPQVIISANLPKENYSRFRKIPGTSIIARKIPKSALRTPITEFRITEKPKSKTTVGKESLVKATKKSSTVIDFIHDSRMTSSSSSTNTEDENSGSNNVTVDESDNDTVVTRISVEDKEKSSKATNSDRDSPNIISKTPFIRVDLGKLKKLGTTDKPTVKTTTKATTITTTKKKMNLNVAKALNSFSDNVQKDSEMDTNAILFIEDLEDDDEVEKNDLSVSIKTDHLRIAHFTCPYPLCNKAFFLRKSRADHVKKVHKKNIINCTFCNSVFCWQNDYGHHFLKEHKIEVALVEKGCCCGRYFNGKILLREHLWKTHYSRGYQCCICSQKFQPTEIEPLETPSYEAYQLHVCPLRTRGIESERIYQTFQKWSSR